MRTTIILLLCLISVGQIKGQDAVEIIKTQFSYTNTGSDYEFYLRSYFSFGPGPKIKWVVTELSNDTVFIKGIYDHRGHWHASFSESSDTIKYINTISGVNYFNVSSNYITVFGFDSTKIDTFWHVHDSTFYIGEVGIKEKNTFREFNVFPNPSNGAISITYYIPPKGTINAKVYDLLSRVVHQEQLTFSSKETSINLNIPNGSFILELKDELGNVQRERIVKQ